MATVFFIAVAMSAPLVWVVRDAVSDGFAGWQQAGSAEVWALLGSTVLLTALVTVISVVLGVGLAVLVTRTDMPFGRLAFWALALPLAIPPFISAIAYGTLFSPAGPVDRITGYSGFVGLDGTTFVLSVGLFPYVFLIASAALQVSSPDREDAARSLGRRPAAVLMRVTVPGIRSAIGAGAILVAFHVLAEFGTPAALRYDTFTTAIFDQLTSLRLDLGAASALSCVLIALAVALIAAEWFIRGRGREAADVRPATPIPLGRWRWAAFGAVVATWVVAAGVPIAWLIWQAFLGARPEGFAGLQLTTGPGTGVVTLNSILVALAVAAGCALLALPAALLLARYRGAGSLLLGGFAQVGYAVPGVVVALALIGMVSGFLSALAGSVLLLVGGLAIRFLPEAIQATRGSFARVPLGMEESARALGSGPVAAFARTTLRMATGGVLVGALLVFLSAIRELPATMLLRPPGFDTLAVRVWTDGTEGLYRQAAPAALLLIAICAACLVVVLRRSRGVAMEP